MKNSKKSAAKKPQLKFKNWYPCGDDIRAAVALRAKNFSEETGIGLSKLSKDAVGDWNFVKDVENGRNITIGLYDQFMEYCDANQARLVKRRAETRVD